MDYLYIVVTNSSLHTRTSEMARKFSVTYSQRENLNADENFPRVRRFSAHNVIPSTLSLNIKDVIMRSASEADKV